MTETRFTPGPWRAVTDPCHFDTLSDVIGGDTRRSPAPVNQLHVGVGGYAGVQEQEANAHLIASAPELYEALQSMCWGFKELNNNIDCGEEYEAYQIALAALAKARGEQS